jgi:hypothetical protein
VLSDDDRALLELLPEAAAVSLSLLTSTAASVSAASTFASSSSALTAGRSISVGGHGPAETSHQNGLNSAVFSTIASSSSSSISSSSLSSSSPLTSLQLRDQLDAALTRIQELQSQLDQHAAATATLASSSSSSSPSSSPSLSSSASAVSFAAPAELSRPLDNASAPAVEASATEASTVHAHTSEIHPTVLLLRAETDAHAQTLAALSALREQYRQQHDAIEQSTQLHQQFLQQHQQQQQGQLQNVDSLQRQLATAQTAAADASAKLQPWQARCKVLEQNIVDLHVRAALDIRIHIFSLLSNA